MQYYNTDFLLAPLQPGVLPSWVVRVPSFPDLYSCVLQAPGLYAFLWVTWPITSTPGLSITGRTVLVASGAEGHFIKGSSLSISSSMGWDQPAAPLAPLPPVMAHGCHYIQLKAEVSLWNLVSITSFTRVTLSTLHQMICNFTLKTRKSLLHCRCKEIKIVHMAADLAYVHLPVFKYPRRAQFAPRMIHSDSKK